MKIVLVAFAAAALMAPGAFAQATTTNSAIIGIQSNSAVGAFNHQSNAVDVLQDGSASARPGFFGPSIALGKNEATVGLQSNSAFGFGNMQTNAVGIGQSTEVHAFPFGGAGASNAATVGAQMNNAMGVGNVQGNSVGVGQMGEAGAGLPLMRAPILIR